MRNTSCKDNCKIQKIKCLTSCKRGFLRRLSKENFLTCFDKCSNSANVCSHRCDCMALVERERKGCDRACDLHPFTESFDLSHCYKECKYDFEWGQKMCDGGSIILHKDPETTLTWSLSRTILDNYHRQKSSGGLHWPQCITQESLLLWYGLTKEISNSTFQTESKLLLFSQV